MTEILGDVHVYISYAGFEHQFLTPQQEKESSNWTSWYLRTLQAYTTNGYRAMLLCDVLPGRKYKTQKRMNGPPAGYNSVEGEVGMELNYPEILLTRSDAIMPRFIIVN